MKSLSVIPFIIGLIGYDKCVQDSPDLWKYGAEYTYRMKVNSSLTYAPTKKKSCSNNTIIFKCRSFSAASEDQADALQCRVQSGKSYQYNINNSLQPPKFDSEEVQFNVQIKDKIFEMLYNKNGIHELRTDPSTTGAETVIFKTLAHHLNLEASDFDQTEDSFTIYKREHSMIGLCKSQIDISTKIKFKSEQWTSRCSDKIHLETFTYGDKHPLIVINKTRDTTQCTFGIPHLFGDNQPNASYNISKSSSFTEFVVAPQSFGSLTVSEGTLSVSHLPQKIITTEFIDVRLISIDPATEPLKRITEIHSSTAKIVEL
ncbi:uncharacterized protein [Fopius arisanus]|uniref:Uncharacterized protein isoform X1 n=1 Tax=Fopius arisanus TaxID=64838 RepID=A0A9R1SWK4_9HYME|nr:PREDICTED: uncharacterized protein LOC105263757 isoform X1 [Fopius arisanus]